MRCGKELKMLNIEKILSFSAEKYLLKGKTENLLKK